MAHAGVLRELHKNFLVYLVKAHSINAYPSPQLSRTTGTGPTPSPKAFPSWMTKPPNGPSNAIAKSMPITGLKHPAPTDASEASQAAAVASYPSGLLPLILDNRRRPEQI